MKKNISASKTKKISKKAVVKKKTAIVKKTQKKEKKVGKVIHYYGKIKVAIIKTGQELKIGDVLHIQSGELDFHQKIFSMHLNHEKIKKAKKGQSIGMKVSKKIKEGAMVYK